MHKFERFYGSDANGLIWAYHFRPGCTAEMVNASTVAEIVRERMPATILQAERVSSQEPQIKLGQPDCGEFLWLHFALSNSHTVPWLKNELKLPEIFFETLQIQTATTRLEQDTQSLIALIHDVTFDLTFDSNSVATSSVFINSHLFVSVRLRPLRSIEALRAEVRQGNRFASPARLLAHLLIDQAEVLEQLVRRTSARVDTIEDKMLANRIAASRSELGTLRRDLVRLKRLLAPEPASFFRLLNRPPKWISEDDLQSLRQAAEEFSTAVNDTQTLIERLKLLQEELAASVNEQTNRTLYVLTLVTVLALPINLTAGLFGMNVGGLPLTERAYGFTLIVVLLLTLTGVLAYAALYRKRDRH